MLSVPLLGRRNNMFNRNNDWFEKDIHHMRIQEVFSHYPYTKTRNIINKQPL